MTVKILVVDDHAVVRRGVVQILHEAFQVSRIGEAETAAEALKHIREETWDAVILDISMPGRSGLEALDEIRAMRPHLPVLVMSMHPEDQMALRVLRSGASGYLTKGSDPEDLVKALKKIMGGGRYASEALAERLIYGLQEQDARPIHESLSNREYEVLRMLASGRTVTEIANDLSLSVKTVSTYHTRILDKMGLRNDSELINYAIRNRLVD